MCNCFVRGGRPHTALRLRFEHYAKSNVVLATIVGRAPSRPRPGRAARSSPRDEWQLLPRCGGGLEEGGGGRPTGDSFFSDRWPANRGVLSKQAPLIDTHGACGAAGAWVWRLPATYGTFACGVDRPRLRACARSRRSSGRQANSGTVNRRLVPTTPRFAALRNTPPSLLGHFL